ncbi:MAG: DUF5677 domain-containing protein [Candidatus Moraniibacteriota bacterium]|jgi:uncharacterized protein DUF5677
MKKHMNQKDFDKWLEIAEEKNDDYFDLIDQVLPIFSEFIKKSTHKSTWFALAGLHTHLFTLKNGTIVLARDNNIYSAKVLYRIFLEHWLKGNYIWTRYTRENSDVVGEEYKNSSMNEALSYVESVKCATKLSGNEEVYSDAWESFCNDHPNIKDLDKNKISKNAKKFKYRNMIKFLIDNEAPGSEWMPIILPEYSELSSFVHGGPDASTEYASELYVKQYDEYRGMIRFQLNICKTFSISIFGLMLKDLSADDKKSVALIIDKLKDEEEFLD